MKILLDHNLPRRLCSYLVGHDVKTTRQMSWDELRNGALIQAAAREFEALITIDKNIEYEQNLSRLPLAVIILDLHSNSMSVISLAVPVLAKLLAESLERSLYIVQPDGAIIPLNEPRLRG